MIEVFLEDKNLTFFRREFVKWSTDTMIAYFWAMDSETGATFKFGINPDLEIYFWVEKKKVWCRVSPYDKKILKLKETK